MESASVTDARRRHSDDVTNTTETPRHAIARVKWSKAAVSDGEPPGGAPRVPARGRCRAAGRSSPRGTRHLHHARASCDEVLACACRLATGRRSPQTASAAMDCCSLTWKRCCVRLFRCLRSKRRCSLRMRRSQTRGEPFAPSRVTDVCPRSSQLARTSYRRRRRHHRRRHRMRPAHESARFATVRSRTGYAQ
jgi:hypothetical protein